MKTKALKNLNIKADMKDLNFKDVSKVYLNNRRNVQSYIDKGPLPYLPIIKYDQNEDEESNNKIVSLAGKQQKFL